MEKIYFFSILEYSRFFWIFFGFVWGKIKICTAMEHDDHEPQCDVRDCDFEPWLEEQHIS